MTNNQVIQAWANGKPGANGRASLHTNGHALFSYQLQIGEWRDGAPVVVNYSAKAIDEVASAGYYSWITSCHVGLARRHAQIVSV